MALAHQSYDGGRTPSRVSMVLGNGDGTFRLTQLLEMWDSFDGDGRVDLAFSMPAGILHVAPGIGDGTVGAMARYSIRGGRLPTGDFDGDGKTDVLAGQSNYALALVKNASP